MLCTAAVVCRCALLLPLLYLAGRVLHLLLFVALWFVTAVVICCSALVNAGDVHCCMMFAAGVVCCCVVVSAGVVCFCVLCVAGVLCCGVTFCCW